MYRISVPTGWDLIGGTNDCMLTGSILCVMKKIFCELLNLQVYPIYIYTRV